MGFRVKDIVTNNYLWKWFRYNRIVASHKKVAEFWDEVIDKYNNGELEHYTFDPKVKFDTDKIIWQYWGQGFSNENLPEIVKICINSVDRYAKKDYTIIRLTDENLGNYIEFPDFVFDKLKNSSFTRTFFSDLLRVALLTTYGGVWLDATILLTGRIPKQFNEYEFFMYQRDCSETNKKFWEDSYAYYWGWDEQFKVRLLNSIIFAKRGNKEIGIILDFLLYYWKKYNNIIDYFFFQILFTELVEKQVINNCNIVSDVIPHYLQAKICNNFTDLTISEILSTTKIHKMTYLNEPDLFKLKLILKL